jgi:hypothetical protein
MTSRTSKVRNNVKNKGVAVDKSCRSVSLRALVYGGAVAKASCKSS